ncbi:hypothetical protein BCR33DRAFT_716275 [Rhizoclosmatium globosum]|uniref:Uncharacterized protein n=1 Tax=Rhizoclosmatium globosum TaxID=329046 RepID=A0A1Y2CF20_9FUNG|nr:hypothetical protein BCR33DRAFT_716275 [Rhizoclosmatium globosum]|eukprot:ORY45629.1 hypothetical protein BCR33DRAFT_716275 [Rhizoclosmatium globosum]
MAPIADIITNSTGGLLPHSHKLVIPASVLEKGETSNRVCNKWLHLHSPTRSRYHC